MASAVQGVQDARFLNVVVKPPNCSRHPAIQNRTVNILWVMYWLSFYSLFLWHGSIAQDQFWMKHMLQMLINDVSVQLELLWFPSAS